jgi:hypothetical protein
MQGEGGVWWRACAAAIIKRGMVREKHLVVEVGACLAAPAAEAPPVGRPLRVSLLDAAHQERQIDVW